MSAGRNGSPYGIAETLSIKERRRRRLTKPQAEIILRASTKTWKNRRELECTESGARALVKAGIFACRLEGTEMVYQLRGDF